MSASFKEKEFFFLRWVFGERCKYVFNVLLKERDKHLPPDWPGGACSLLRPGVLWFFRRQDDPEAAHLVRDMLRPQGLAPHQARPACQQ